MAEVASGITRGHEINGGSNRCFERVLGANADAAQIRLDLAESQLNGVEVGGVAGEVERVAACLADRGAHPFLLVDVEVVHHDDLPWLERWQQDPLDVEPERRPVNRTIKEQAGAN